MGMMDSLTVEMIAEPIVTVPHSADAAEARRIMQKQHFDVLGVKDDDGKVVGYIKQKDASGGKVKDVFKEFSIDKIVSSGAPLKDCIQLVCDNRRLFVLTVTGVRSIVTVADLRKPPVCLMIFGRISLLETILLEWIRDKYPDEAWREKLNEDRVKKAEELYEERREKKQEIDLADCLYLCDKKDIIIKTADLLSKLGFQSKRKAERFFKQLQDLRDNLAHAQAPDKAMEWPQIAELTHKSEEVAERILQSLENGDRRMPPDAGPTH